MCICNNVDWGGFVAAVHLIYLTICNHTINTTPNLVNQYLFLFFFSLSGPSPPLCMYFCQLLTSFFPYVWVSNFRLPPKCLVQWDITRHIIFLKNLFIYLFLLCWVFVSVRGLSLVVASGGHSSSRCAGLSLSRPILLWTTGSRRAGSVIVAHGPSCSAACGIFPDQGSNPCPLHWQADSQPLRHQGSPQAHDF